MQFEQGSKEYQVDGRTRIKQIRKMQIEVLTASGVVLQGDVLLVAPLPSLRRWRQRCEDEGKGGGDRNHRSSRDAYRKDELLLLLLLARIAGAGAGAGGGGANDGMTSSAVGGGAEV